MSDQQRKKVAAKMAGKGGLKCQCCGPAPKDKKSFLRTAKRVENQQAKKDINDQLQQDQ